MRGTRFWIVGKLAALAAAMAVTGIAPARADRAAEVIRIWPGDAPGAAPLATAETSRRLQSGENEITVVQHVSVPTLTVIRPEPGKANGTAMLVAPGGAFMALAWDLEGLEVARWLADHGITVFVLKYRVSELKLPPGAPTPDFAELARKIQPNRKLAVADAGQAMTLIRRDAAKYRIDPDRVGMIGFSAGAATTMGLLLERPPAQRPNFAAPIYGMTLIDNPTVPTDAPPIFIAVAQDDQLAADASVEIYRLWRAARRPAELHVYEIGGHGFGMRPKGRPVDHWPAALEAWLRAHGLLQRKAAR